MRDPSTDTSWPSHAMDVLMSYLGGGEDGLADVEETLRRRARERPGGKFGKAEARYLPQSPFPPTLWRTQCGRCRFWHEDERGGAGRCHVVGRPGDRFGGERIHPNGWCAFWTPPRNEPALRWAFEQLDPTGADLDRGTYRDRRPTETEQTTITGTASGGDQGSGSDGGDNAGGDQSDDDRGGRGNG